jgi:hypothetical protein
VNWHSVNSGAAWKTSNAFDFTFVPNSASHFNVACEITKTQLYGVLKWRDRDLGQMSFMSAMAFVKGYLFRREVFG